MRDLRDELEVLPGSLYAAFGDKHALFLRALQSFSREMNESVSTLGSCGPAAAVDALLTGVLDAATNVPGRGCMLGNTAVELVPEDVPASTIVRDAFAALETKLEGVLRAGQETGAFRGDIDARSLACMLVALVQGLHVIARAESDPQRLKTVVSAAGALLTTPRTGP